MEQVLLWASLVVGLAVYLFRFLPFPAENKPAADEPTASVVSPELNPALLSIGIASPFLGWLVTLPTAGFFSNGQQLGIGFLIGGLGALLAQANLGTLPWLRASANVSPMLRLVATNGIGIATAAFTVLFLPASRLDALMGVAIGWFCTTMAFFLALPRDAQRTMVGRQMAAGAGLTATLSASLMLAMFHASVTPLLAKLSWSATLLGFAALGTLLIASAARLPVGHRGSGGRLLPLILLALGGGAGLYEVGAKVTNEPRLAIIGVGGLLLWPVALAVLHEAWRRGRQSANGLPIAFLPMVLLTTGFVAAYQLLHSVGVAVLLIALWLALPATVGLLRGPGSEETSEEQTLGVNMLGLLLFGTVLLMWRLCMIRFSDELRGVILTDQYALLGLMTGAALPSLLAAVSGRWQGGKDARAWIGVGALVVTALLTLAAPAVLLVLFGPKSILALLFGLALGIILTLVRDASPLPALLALAVTLAIDQWTGQLLPENTPTRVEKIRWLVGLMAVVVTATLGSDFVFAWWERREKR